MKGINLSLAFNLEQIYDNANFQINDNDKVGITGVNGAGKTTLFKLILKELTPDSGELQISNKKRIGYLPQEVILDDINITVFDYLMTARPLKELEARLTREYDEVAVETDLKLQNKLLKDISKTQELLDYYQYYEAENILFELINNMQIDTALLDMKLNDLSGGQKSKIAFAHLLYSNPEILLLDEPTNHLDVTTRDYIINYLKEYKGTILIISHDMHFLDQIINKTLYIDKVSKKITVYEGNYTTFLKKAKQAKDIKEKLIEKEDNEINKLRDIVLLYSNSSGKRKKMAQSREKMLAKKMDARTGSDKTYKRIKLNIKPNQEESKTPLIVNNLSFSYPNSKELFHNLSFLINRKERFLIVGENGVGKSTLLKLLMNILTPKEGTIYFGSKTDVAYYAQEQEELNRDKNVLENIDDGTYSLKEIRTILGSFLFHGDDVFKQANVLSPGERARIALCKTMIKRANLLLLDEPTNHLDPDTQKIIGENFSSYNGTIILVSHNPEFVNMIGIDRMLILPSGKITNYSEEKLDYYYRLNTKNE